MIWNAYSGGLERLEAGLARHKRKEGSGATMLTQYVQAPGGTIDLYDRPGNSDFSAIGQSGGVDRGLPGNDYCSCTDFEDSATCPSMAAELRSGRTLVSVGAAGRVACRRVAWIAGAAAHGGSLFRAARSGYIADLLDLDFRNARQPGRQDGCIRRRLRLAADRLDRPERHLHVSAHLRGGTFQGASGEPDGNHPRPAPAVAAHRFQLRRFL